MSALCQALPGMIQKYMKPENLVASQGQCCGHYRILAALCSQIYLGNCDLEEADTMLTAAIEYQMTLQGPLWLKDRLFLALIRDLAETSWEQ